MRGSSLLLIGAALGSCSTAPERVVRSSTGQIAYDKLVADKVAGPPISCLPNYNANDMSVIDSQTVAFRVGGRPLRSGLAKLAGTPGRRVTLTY